jgi:hypothetical protein
MTGTLGWWSGATQGGVVLVEVPLLGGEDPFEGLLPRVIGGDAACALRALAGGAATQRASPAI